MNTQDSIHSFLEEAAPGFLAVEPVAGDASVRAYYRVRTGGGSCILCSDPNLNRENFGEYPFFVMAALLEEHAIAIPRVLAADADRGLILLQDLGDCLMEDVVPGLDREKILVLYRKVIDVMVRLQTIPPGEDLLPFRLSFDREKLDFELEFFLSHACGDALTRAGTHREVDELRAIFAGVITRLEAPELFVLNHRDFHSRNVMLFNDRPVLIDFQDARMGLPQYDAVSFIMDPYTVIEGTAREDLIDYHYRALAERGYARQSWARYRELFDWSAFQRHVKVLGTYLYQSKSLGNRRFVKPIGTTLAYLEGYCTGHPEMNRALEIIRALIPDHGPAR